MIFLFFDSSPKVVLSAQGEEYFFCSLTLVYRVQKSSSLKSDSNNG